MEMMPTTRELAEALDISRVFAWEVRNGKKGLSEQKLVRAWRERGWKLGRLAGQSDQYADDFARLVEARQ